ncbi:MAG: hypothetical protein ACI9JM_000810 [Halioglobus sp.]|jgi:hypothetical protein
MHLANSLNAEPGCSCVHEGKFRHRESSGEQILPFLTLENRIAYETPEKAQDIIDTKRAVIDNLEMGHASHFGDIAYNNSPFLVPLSIRFPTAKFIIVVRDGRMFARSATVLEGEDETPVGWPPNDKETTRLEDYISLGRFQPRRDSKEQDVWNNWSALQKNVWLWAETNTLILDALEKIDNERWMLIRFENFVSKPLEVYTTIRQFLEFEEPLSQETTAVLLSPVVNASRSFTIPLYDDWPAADKAHFHQYAGPVMKRLEYHYE